MMVLEIAGGWYYNSMALLVDGWHMSSHVVALGLALGAYMLVPVAIVYEQAIILAAIGLLRDTGRALLDAEMSAGFFKQQLAIHEELVHITVELNPLRG